MLDSNEINDALKIFEEPLNVLMLPLASTMGQTFADFWDICFGKTYAYAEKQRIIRKQCLEDFKHSLIENTQKIPKENLIEPRFSIVAPALETSKYYFDEEYLRQMFAKLIANAMDSRIIDSIHPSFVDTIKQLSPLDAQNLSLFDRNPLPLAEYRYRNKTKVSSYSVIITNVFLANAYQSDIEKLSLSLSVLSRLNLISTTFSASVHNASYADFEKTSLFLEAKQKFEDQENEVFVVEGGAELTPYGKAFISVCLP